ncbi:MAG TPA: pitrilysin family protein [Clostridia bacterium]|nr:pitrilysin family protein [Clostridia bacterium]
MLSDYTRFELPNSLRVINVPLPGISSATVLVLVGAGSRYEQENKAGLSHFLEHMIFKGTKKRPTTFDISSAVDSVGGENNAFTGKNYTGYYIKVNSEHLPLAFDVLSDTLQNSLFLKEEIERERGAIIEEINMYEDTPMYKIDDVFYQLMFDGSPLGWLTTGTKKTVAAIQRQDFLDYGKRFYQGSDMVLVVAGNTKLKEIKALAEKFFGPFARGKKEEFVPFEEEQKKPRVKVEFKKTDQAHLYLGFPAFTFFDPDKEALDVLSAILGGGMSSRLFIQVRERRGLAYYVTATTDYYSDTGLVAARAGLNLNKIDEAIKVILEEFGKLKNKDVSKKELDKAKEFIKGRTTLSLENSRATAGWYAERELLKGRVETPSEAFAKIDKVTLDDVQKVAERLFKPEKRNLAIIGPFEDKEKFLPLLEG